MSSTGGGLDLLEEVGRFFNKTRISDYGAFVQLLVRRFEEFSLRSAPLGPIYRVYSRGAKQGGDELKEQWKIAEKVSLVRRGKRKTHDGTLTDIEPQPGFPIQDLGDIVGLTVVCIFPSDISVVMAYVEESVSHGELLQFDSEPKKDGGYYAHHYVLGLPDSRFRDSYRCEVQIKTILHDAWSAKTHDLTYKPEAELDNRMKRQMNHLGDALNAIDQLSELLKDLITERWKVDDVRKDAARAGVLLRLREVKRPADRSKARQFDAILDELVAKQDALRIAPRFNSEIDTILGQIKSFLGGGPHNFDSCRMMAALACMRKDNDLDNAALDSIERWVTSASDIESKYDALLFHGLVLFCFGRLEEAISATKEALRAAEGRDTAAARAAGNLAYFHAEIGGSELGNRLNAMAEARNYVSLSDAAMSRAEAGRTVDKGLSPEELETLDRAWRADRAKLKDTKGTVLIAFGESPEEVREGLRLCTEAKAEDPYGDVAEAFFVIHERRAFRRILSWK